MSGEVPEGWRSVPLGEHCRIEIGGTPSRDKPQFWSTEKVGRPWVSIADLKTHRVDRTKEFISDLGVANSNVKLVPRGTIMMSFKLTIGKTAIAERDLYTNEAIVACFPDREIDKDFLFYALPYAAGRAETDQAIKGATLNKAKLRSLRLSLPPLDEQRRIAEVLRSVDEAIRLAKATVEQSLRCLDSTLTKLMDGSGEMDGEGWTEGRCDTFFVLQRGFDITESQATPGPHNVISSSGPSYTHTEARVAAPVVITGRKGRLGTVFYSEAPCWPHDTTLWVKDFKGNNPRFVFWKLRSMKLEAFDAATSVPTLNRNNVHALSIRLPPVKRQVAINYILDAQELQVLSQRAQVRALDLAKISLVSDLLSGRVRVPA